MIIIHFQAWSLTQIGYMTTSQAGAVTLKMQLALTDAQLEALIAAGGFEYATPAGDKVGSGAGENLCTM